MAREKFKDRNFTGKAMAQITQANQIIADYQADNLRLTLRQLYYQFVSRNWITNEEKSYKNLGKTISEARLAGLVDWDSIEDRGRVVSIYDRSPGADIEADVKAAIDYFALSKWEQQPEYVELWVEKQALAGVLEPIASRYRVPLMVNKGYSSQSAMKEAAERFREFSDRDCTLIYLGDHDPSGEDMVRDIGDRLETFGVTVTVDKVALTMAQIRKFNPPPNPAKVTDSRAAAYIRKHGNSSWEVDALPPRELNRLITAAIVEHVDQDLWDEVKAKQEAEKKRMRAKMLAGGKGKHDDAEPDDDS